METLVDVLGVVVIFIWLPFVASVVLYKVIKDWNNEE